jgi:hypothetical protein
MPDVALSNPESRARDSAPPAPDARARVPRGVLITAGVLLAVSTLIVIWARTRPSFDAFGWLTWGRQTLAWSLNTNAAPSWKPLPYLFTVPYALFGNGQMWLWLITVVAVSLAGVVCAARIAYRLTVTSPQRRLAGYVAGAFAGLALLGIRDYPHYILSAQSDPMIVTLCLAAIDAHLSGRPRLAFVLACLGGFGRPEVWPFTALYGIWMWRALPRSRGLVIGGALTTLALWFGIPALTSRSPFVAGTNALGSVRALKHDRVFGTIDRFLDMHETALELAALLAIGLAALRRDRATLVLAAGMVGWVLVEIAFALHGWPGLTRYMYEAGGVMVVLAGVGVGWLIPDARAFAALRTRPRRDWLFGAGGAVIAAAIVLALVPAAVTRARAEHHDLKVERARTALLNQLSPIVTKLGGRSLLAHCGEPLTSLQYQSILAWTLHINVAKVGWKFDPAIRAARAIVIFDPHGHSWRVLSLRQRVAGCPHLPQFTRVL